MRQKYDNPAPLTMNMALDFNLLEALNDDDYLPKTVAINKPRKTNPFSHKKNDSPKHFRKSNPKQQDQLPTKILSFQKTHLALSHQMFKPGSQDQPLNKKLNIRTSKKRNTTQAKKNKSKQKFIKEYVSSQQAKYNKTYNRMSRTLSLAQTISNFNDSHKRFDNPISSLSRQNFNITKDLQMENNKALMVNIRKNLLKSNLSASQQQQIRSVYKVITQKLSQNTDKPFSKPTQLEENMKKSNQYIKSLNKVDLLEPKTQYPIHNRPK